MKSTPEDTKINVTANSKTTARMSIAGAALFLVLLVALHFIKPEVDPSWRMISEYEIGNYGWIMSLAFLSLSFSYLTLFITIRPEMPPTIAGRIGLALLMLGVIGSAMGGIFISDPITTEQVTLHGNLHGIGALLGIPTLPIAATLISRGLARNPAWTSARTSLFWAAALTWVGLLVFALSMTVMLPRGHGKFTPDVLIGWTNRLLIVTYVVWLLTVSRQALILREYRNL